MGTTLCLMLTPLGANWYSDVDLSLTYYSFVTQLIIYMCKYVNV